MSGCLGFLNLGFGNRNVKLALGILSISCDADNICTCLEIRLAGEAAKIIHAGIINENCKTLACELIVSLLCYCEENGLYKVAVTVIYSGVTDNDLVGVANCKSVNVSGSLSLFYCDVVKVDTAIGTTKIVCTCCADCEFILCNCCTAYFARVTALNGNKLAISNGSKVKCSTGSAAAASHTVNNNLGRTVNYDLNASLNYFVFILHSTAKLKSLSKLEAIN